MQRDGFAGLGGLVRRIDVADGLDIVAGQRFLLGLAGILERVHRGFGDAGGEQRGARRHRVAKVVDPRRIAEGQAGMLEAQEVTEFVRQGVLELGRGAGAND